jgi:pilus assembly protein FimV
MMSANSARMPLRPVIRAAQTRQRLQNIENRLAVRQEDLDRQAMPRTKSSTPGLAMLQQQIASAQEIIRLRDLELAQLQQSLAEQTPASATALLPQLITMAPDAGPVERFVNAVISNTWALLGGALALILALVLILVPAQ